MFRPQNIKKNKINFYLKTLENPLPAVTNVTFENSLK